MYRQSRLLVLHEIVEAHRKAFRCACREKASHVSGAGSGSARLAVRAHLWWISITIKGVKRQMKQHEVTVPQIGLIAGTRAMLGAGIALLLSEKLSGEQRRAIGWTLVAVGALTTIPLALQLLSDDD